MISIAFVHSVAKIGGAERVSQMLMSELNSKEFTCFLVCPDQGELVSWAKNNNVDCALLPMEQPGLSNAYTTLKQSLQWRSWLLENNIDIIHTADPYCTRVATIPAKLSKVKLLSHYHFPFEAEHLAWLLRYLPKPDVCVFCSKDLKNEVGTHLQTISPSSKLLTIHNGVNIERFSPTKKEAGADLNIGIIANLQFRKGHDEFIHMASILVKSYNNISFHIIGGDLLQEPREAILKKLAMELNVQDKVTFHGQVPDVLNELDTLDIVVCASHQEAFPIAILEAMAMQKAIVSTNVNGIPEAVIDGQSGILTAPYQPIQLATAVSKLIDNPQLRQELAKNARTRVVEMFSSDVFINRFEALYRDLI